VTVAVRIGHDDNRVLGEKETGGRAALPIFRDVVQGIYTQGLMGTTPAFPEEMEQRITDYVAGAAAEDSEEWAGAETAPAFEPAVLPARLMPALALAPVTVAPTSPLFDPARSDPRSRRP
jgi:membrane carboxypeptidase/penicillin-binding protein